MYNQDISNKLYTYFKLNVRMRDYRNGWLKGDCPFCGKLDKFGVNIYLNRSNCFYCGPKPKPFSLLMELEKANKVEAFKILGNEEPLQYFYSNFEDVANHRRNIELPSGFRLLNMGNSQLAKSARNYVKSRGFNPDDMSIKGWGYGSEGKYYGYLIIPIYYKGDMVYFTSRRFLGNGPKFLNLTTEETGLGKNFVIYNHEAIFMYDRIRLVESIMNAETLGDNTIAINGKTLSTFQFNQIIKSPVTHITILLDNDAWEHSLNMAMKLVDFKYVKPIYFDDNRDVNDLGRKNTLKKIYKNKYLNHRELIKLKNEGPINTYN